jgi:uncharacterized iron-regulated membrane protein
MESTPRRAALHRLLWRLHFWAGLIGAPIVLFAALTGLLYVFTPQIEAWRHADLDRVPVGSAPRPLDEQVAAVREAFPDAPLRFVVPSYRPGDSTQVHLRREPSAAEAHGEHAGHGGAPGSDGHDRGLPSGSIAYVDPYAARVLGRLDEMERFGIWAKKLHSSALQGDGWRWLLELGASWMLVLFATGLTLWWPRSQAGGGPGWRALLPRLGRGRRSWRDLHATVAIALGLLLSVVLVTGLTWTKYSGDNFRKMQAALDQAAPKPNRSLQSVPREGLARLRWQEAYDHALALGPDIAMQITPPATIDGTWRIENFDRSQPNRRFIQVLDAYSGEPLFRSDWTELPLLSKATAIGIPFHRGEFGVWNQVLLALAALAAVFSVLSGLVMWWLRRPRGKLAAPRLNASDVRHAPLWVWPVAAALGWALPVFGWSLAVLTVLESLWLLVLVNGPVLRGLTR